MLPPRESIEVELEALLAAGALDHLGVQLLARARWLIPYLPASRSAAVPSGVARRLGIELEASAT